MKNSFEKQIKMSEIVKKKINDSLLTPFKCSFMASSSAIRAIGSAATRAISSSFSWRWICYYYYFFKIIFFWISREFQQIIPLI